MPSILVEVQATIADLSAKMAEAKGEVDDLAKHGASASSKLATVGKSLAEGIAGGVVAVGAAAVELGNKLEDSQASLSAALKASGSSLNAHKASIDATGAAAVKYGFTQAQVDAALAVGVISTQSYTKAHQNLSVAVELAAAKHTDLTSAMQTVDKAATGNLRALKQMGIDLPIVTTSAEKLVQAHQAVALAQSKVTAVMQQYPDAANAASKGHQAYETAAEGVWTAQVKLNQEQGASKQILDALSQRLSGQASAAADTFSGKIKAIEAQGENWGASLGMFLIPKIELLVTDVEKSIQWLSKHKDILYAIGAVTVPFVAAAIGAFAINTLGNMVKSIGQAIDSVEQLGSKLLGLGNTSADVSVEESTSASGGALGSGTAGTSALSTAASELSAAAADLSGAAGDLVGGGGALDGAAAGLDTSAGSLDTSATGLDESSTGLDATSSEMSADSETDSADMTAAASALDTAAEALDVGAAAEVKGGGLGGLFKGGILGSIASKVPALAALTGGLQLIENPQAYIHHKPTAGDITHPSEYATDIAHGIGNALNALGIHGFATLGATPPRTNAQDPMSTVPAKDATVKQLYTNAQQMAKAIDDSKGYLQYLQSHGPDTPNELKQIKALQKDIAKDKTIFDQDTKQINAIEKPRKAKVSGTIKAKARVSS